MDDTRFDDHIRTKIGDYEATGFDADALANLHMRLGSIRITPWYRQYSSYLLTGMGIVLATLFIVGNQWYMSNRNADILESSLQEHRATIDILRTEVEELKNVRPDTIRIVEKQPVIFRIPLPLLERIGSLEQQIAALLREQQTTTDDDRENRGDEMQPNWSYVSNIEMGVHGLARRSVDGNKVSRPPLTASILVKDNNANQDLSAVTIRALEEHYHPGIGIRIAPAVEVANGFYEHGKSQPHVSGGLQLDFILSPSLSIETGARYSRRYYEADEHNGLSDLQLPGMDESAGTLQKAEMDYWVTELPLYLKYRYPFSAKSYCQGSIGYSTLFYFRQVFEYDYAFAADNRDMIIHSVYETGQTSFSPGAVSISFGLGRHLKNNKIIEASLYYQRGLGPMGLEQTNADFLGIRSAYWFTLK